MPSKSKNVAKNATTNETAIVTATEVTNNESSLAAPFQTTNFFGYSLSIYGDVENPLFLAREVAEMIEHVNVSEMIKLVDENERLTSKLLRAGQAREVNMLTEDGLYELLMRSTKPIAKDFKRAIKSLLKDIRLERHRALLTTAEANNEIIAKLEKELADANAELAKYQDKIEAAREEYKSLAEDLRQQKKWSWDLRQEKERVEEANKLIRFRLKCMTEENNGVYNFIEKNGSDVAKKHLLGFPSLNVGA